MSPGLEGPECYGGKANTDVRAIGWVSLCVTYEDRWRPKRWTDLPTPRNSGAASAAKNATLFGEL